MYVSRMALRNNPSTTALVTSSSFAHPRIAPITVNRATNTPQKTTRLPIRCASEARRHLNFIGDRAGCIGPGETTGRARHGRQPLPVTDQAFDGVAEGRFLPSA